MLKKPTDCDGEVALIFCTLHVDFYFFGQTIRVLSSFSSGRPRGCTFKETNLALRIANQIDRTVPACANKLHFIINILIDICVMIIRLA